MSLYTPAARQPGFACPQCPRRVFDRAALKNHIRARHQSRPLPAHEPTTPQQSSDDAHEEPIPIPSTASPAVTENRIQLPLSDIDDRDYDENNIPPSDLGGSTSRGSTPIWIPSSPSHGPTMRAHAEDKYFRRIYHPTLNGQGFLIYYIYRVLTFH